MPKTRRVRMLRHIQGLNKDSDTGELEILTKGSVVDLPELFAHDIVGSKGAEYVDGATALVAAPLAPSPDFG